MLGSIGGCDEYSSLGIFGAFQLDHLMMYHLASLKVQCLVLLILPNLEKSSVLHKVYGLVNMSDVLKVSLYVPCLDLLEAVMNIVHLEYLGLSSWII